MIKLNPGPAFFYTTNVPKMLLSVAYRVQNVTQILFLSQTLQSPTEGRGLATLIHIQCLVT